MRGGFLVCACGRGGGCVTSYMLIAGGSMTCHMQVWATSTKVLPQVKAHM